MKRIGFLPVLVLLAALLPGCGSAAPDAILRLPLYGHPARALAGLLDPALATPQTPIALAELFHSGLMKFGPDMHVIPELAVSIPTISGGGRTYTFTIRQDARFADDRPCTAADVASSFVRALLPHTHSPTAWQYLGEIEGAGAVAAGRSRTLSGVRVLDPLTVRIELIHRDASFLAHLAFPVAAIVAPGTRSPPAGLGPYEIESRATDGSVLLRPRPHYYADPLGVRHVRLVPVASVAAGLSLYKKGHLDAAEVSYDSYASVDGRSDFRESSALDGYYLIPARPAPALQTALNRNALVAGLPALSPLTSIVPPTVPDYVPPALSGGAGSGQHLPVELRYARNDPAAVALAGRIARQWPVRAGGEAVVLKRADYLLPDPARWLALAPGADLPDLTGQLRAAAGLTNDPVSRMNTYSALETKILARGIVIPLASENLAFLINNRVSALQMSPAGLLPQNNSWPLVDINR